MPIVDDYGWQKIAYAKWVDAGHKGVIKAVPGAGKTLAGVRVIENYVQDHPGCNIVVCAPTDAIITQWVEQLRHVGLCNLKVMTYFGAVKFLESGAYVNLLVLDECHAAQTPVQGQVLSHGVEHLLGLSATPEESPDLIGPIIVDVTWAEAKIAPFEIIYITFPLTIEEEGNHRRLTNKVKSVLQAEEAGQKVPYKMSTIMERRSFVYMLPRRVELAVDLILSNPDERIMVFTERVEQLRQIAEKLDSYKVPYAVRVGREDSLKKYQSFQCNVMLSVKMLKEGFNDPTTTMGIVVSSALTERNQVQTMGRMVRFQEGKTAKVYWLLASRTSDENLIRKGIPGKEIRLQEEYFSNSTGGVNNNTIVEASVHQPDAPVTKAMEATWDGVKEVQYTTPAPGVKVIQSYEWVETITGTNALEIGDPCPKRLTGLFLSVDTKGAIFAKTPGGRKYIAVGDTAVLDAAKWMLQHRYGGIMVINEDCMILTRTTEAVVYIGTTTVAAKEAIVRQIYTPESTQ